MRGGSSSVYLWGTGMVAYPLGWNQCRAWTVVDHDQGNSLDSEMYKVYLGVVAGLD